MLPMPLGASAGLVSADAHPDSDINTNPQAMAGRILVAILLETMLAADFTRDGSPEKRFVALGRTTVSRGPLREPHATLWGRLKPANRGMSNKPEWSHTAGLAGRGRHGDQTAALPIE